MKKYVKPELRFESYELNHSVADCGWELQFDDGYKCNATGDPDFALPAEPGAFMDGGICVWEPDGYCYQNGTGGMAPLFRS